MFSNLLKNIDLLEKDKEIILDAWMAYSVVQTTLQKHDFDIAFYRKHFAAKVYDYAIGVIKTNNQLGQCPVINVMLMLFKKKNIPLSDVFMICVHLKNAFICYAHKNLQLDQHIITEISELMDFNFKGVIDEYVLMFCSSPRAEKYILKIKDSQKTVPKTIIKDTPVTKALTSAQTYLEEVEVDYHAIDELEELESEALDAIDSQAVITQEALEESALLFSKYASVLNSLYEFEELSYTLTILSDLVSKAEFTQMDDDIQSYIQIYLKAIISDLQSWRMSIFVTQEADDVHYLDKTLLSSISQLQMTLMPHDDSSSDDIEFF